MLLLLLLLLPPKKSLADVVVVVVEVLGAGGYGCACTEKTGARHDPHHPGVPGAQGLLYPPGTKERFKETNSLQMD